VPCACSSSSSSTSSISAENTFGAAARPHAAPRSPDRGYPIYATIDAPALRNRRVGERYLEVELIAYIKGTPVENITHLRFAE
jgi:hypothetical protein